MGRTIATGKQDFEELITEDCFYIDKTDFIREWWESGDDVTLITRPRRFGKTLNMSMLNCFFSNQYANRGDLFEGLSIWQHEEYRKLQGTYPVINLSFAKVKEKTYEIAVRRINRIITGLYNDFVFLLEDGGLTEQEIDDFKKVSPEMSEDHAEDALCNLSKYLSRYYGKKVIILLDEYDTPMQEAYLNGYWDEFVPFMQNIFHATFKSNPYLKRSVMTGITRVSKDSFFSDLNNLSVITTTSEKYETAFGFTEEEVFQAMDEMGMTEKKEVKRWYDGFVFGEVRDIYNPWSICQLLNERKFEAYWTNTSSNALVGKLIREGKKEIKVNFETLLKGETLKMQIDEQVVYNQLGKKRNAIWSLLLASGYLKVIHVEECKQGEDKGQETYELALTNWEVTRMFRDMVRDWFCEEADDYDDFKEALLTGDIDQMNECMQELTLSLFSRFDTGTHPSRTQPERFYHGFVLGMIVTLQSRYIITSNRESGYGRYDIMLEPKSEEDDAIIIEFKVFDKRKEKTLEETVAVAQKQIKEKAYAQILLDKGIPKERIRAYGFAFEGKKVLIG